MRLLKDESGIVYAIIVLLLALTVFSFAYLLTYNFIMVECNETFEDTAPPEVNKTFDDNWKLLAYVVFGGIGFWFFGYIFSKQGRWKGGG